MLTLPPLHFSSLGWLAVIGGAFGIGLNKGGLTGLGILPVLLFAVVFNARESTGFVLPLLIVGMFAPSSSIAVSSSGEFFGASCLRLSPAS